MNDTLQRYMAGLPQPDQNALRPVLQPIADRLSSLGLITAGLVIKAGGSALVKTGAAVWYGLVQGKLVKIAAATDMPALSGSVTNAKFNVFCFFVDTAGTVTGAMGTEGATLAAIQFPPFPQGKTLIGFVIVNPTGTGPFVGGTTALDDATVVPNAVYISDPKGIDPTVLL